MEEWMKKAIISIVIALWNGVEVSNQSIYVPNTYDLKSGK